MPYTSRQMYDLVADIESYPKFIPWCAAVHIHSRHSSERGQIVVADLVASFQAFRETMRSRVKLADDHSAIDVSYLKGPLKHFHSTWRFYNRPDGSSDVEFEVEFEFRSRIIEKLVGIVFGRAMETIVAAFEKRAREIYGDAI